MRKFTFSILIILIYASAFTQNDMDQSFANAKKNTIHWNITPLLFDKSNLTLGYERVLKNNQSFSVNSGIFLLPKLFKNESSNIYFVEKVNRLGYSITGDYRFYLQKYNKKAAPAGVYIGPYFGHYHYGFDNTLLLNAEGDVQSHVDIAANFNMTSAGIELGYQFVFWDKVSLDLILIGPSLSFYNAKIDASADLDVDEDSDAYEYIHDKLLEKYPWLETFIDLDAINTGGKFNATAFGFRYAIQIGYRF